MTNRAWFRIRITDDSYSRPTYTIAVEARSRLQAVAIGAAKIGQTHAEREGFPAGLLDPDVSFELISLDEYWSEKDEVKCQE
jgi:hypothetical protein